jgi:hypothetical protein
MTLLNAPAYDERKEKLKKFSLIGGAVLIVVLVLTTLAGYALGHGWFFSNLPAEHKVSNFFAALQVKDYNKAFAIYNNDPDWQQHPDQYKDYPEARFQDDWATQDPIDGPLLGYHVDISKTDGDSKSGGIIVAVTADTVKGKKRIFMYYLRSSGKLTWPAFHELQY